MNSTETLVLPNTAHPGFIVAVRMAAPDWATEEQILECATHGAAALFVVKAHLAAVPADAGNRPA